MPAHPEPPAAGAGLQVVSLSQRSRADLNRFIQVPRAAAIQALYAPYRGVWCPYTEDTLRQTLSLENPVYEHTDCQLFVASRAGADVGRVAAFHNSLSSLTLGQRLGAFGFFEAADEEVARALLLEGAWPWLRKLGLKGMVGNISPTTNDEIGVLIRGYHRHQILLEFNPPEYPGYFERLGFAKAMDVHSYTTPLDAKSILHPLSGSDKRQDMADLAHVARLVARRAGVTMECLDKRNVARAAREFCALYNRAWRDHWGYEPFSSAELLYLARDLLLLLPSELLLFARNKEGLAVGAVLAAPDLNQLFRDFDGRMGLREQLAAVLAMWAPRWLPVKRPDFLRVIGLGVLPEYAKRGAAGALMSQVTYNAYRLGMREASLSWILEDNEAMLAVPRKFKLKIDQTWRLYQYRPAE